MVEGIEKLRPGHWLEWRAGKIREEAYWRFRAAPRKWTLGRGQERARFALKAAVREHLLSDVPLGLWLSGGMDSSTLLHYAASESSPRLKTLSIRLSWAEFR